jgi:hypothetical protein
MLLKRSFYFSLAIFCVLTSFSSAMENNGVEANKKREINEKIIKKAFETVNNKRLMKRLLFTQLFSEDGQARIPLRDYENAFKQELRLK